MTWRFTSTVVVLGFLVIAVAIAPPSEACTNILVTKGASKDGSSIITYACDGRFHARLRNRAAADHPEGAEREMRSWSGELRGKIPEAKHTHASVGR